MRARTWIFYRTYLNTNKYYGLVLVYNIYTRIHNVSHVDTETARAEMRTINRGHSIEKKKSLRRKQNFVTGNTPTRIICYTCTCSGSFDTDEDAGARIVR